MAKSPAQDVGVVESAKDCGAVDIEAMISAFLADESRKSLDLPRSLTAEQRKQAKRLAEQHQGLKCESYGYGEERQLHLFKQESKDNVVRVKNTFIDDWEGASGEEQAIFRSMPPSMPVDLLLRTLERCKVTSDGSGTPAPEPASGAGAAKPAHSSGTTAGPALPPLPNGLQVRNTFIHIESLPEVERVVQSMPHGMFRQCLEAELSAQSPAGNSSSSPAATAAPPAAADAAAAALTPAEPEPQAIAPGTEVTIHGLVKLPDFNGLAGVVQSFDPESGRYDVLLASPAGQCGWRWVKVKRDNCRLCMPPPPSKAPTLSLDCMEDESTEAVPPTPHWEEDLLGQAGGLEPGAFEQKCSATPLRLNALV